MLLKDYARRAQPTKNHKLDMYGHLSRADKEGTVNPLYNVGVGPQ